VVGPELISLEMTDERGCSAAVTACVPPLDNAVTPQEAPRRRILDKLGGTAYRAGRIVDLAGSLFIPASVLTALRRDCLDALERASRATYRYTYRLPEKFDVPLPYGESLTVHDNVANRLAREFYISHGAKNIVPAVEIAKGPLREAGEPVMTTRYCLRRELGKCLKDGGGKDWKAPLTLVSGQTRLRVEFDCKACRMNLYNE
ncbi:MAG: DUF3656 domain-containing protein, partial [Duncaniella sp.]|nr:DUF3656 domain-containing protein [Duncaniella sp.]